MTPSDAETMTRRVKRSRMSVLRAISLGTGWPRLAISFLSPIAPLPSLTGTRQDRSEFMIYSTWDGEGKTGQNLYDAT